MININNFLQNNIEERELIKQLEGKFDKMPLRVNYDGMLSALEDTVKVAFYKSACESIKDKLFEAKEELANCSVIEKREIPSKIDTVLERVKVGEDSYVFEKEGGRIYNVNSREGARTFILSYMCPSDFGVNDSKEENNGKCDKKNHCGDCWNAPIIDEQELLKKVKDNISNVLDRVIMAGIIEAEQAMYNMSDKESAEETTDNKEVMSRLDVVVKKQYSEEDKCLKYCGRKVTEEELRHQLMHHNCPSYFGLQDKCDDNVQERIREIVPIEECEKCWNMPFNAKADAQLETLENTGIDERDFLKVGKLFKDGLSISFSGNDYNSGFGTSCEFNIDSEIKPMLKVEEREHHDDPKFGGTDAYVEMREGRIEKDEETGEIVVWIFEPTMNNGGKFLHEIEKVLHYDKDELQDEIIGRWIRDCDKRVGIQRKK